MATGLRRVLGQLQQAGGGLSDRQLLARFVAARDETAFAALVRRHGPMVLGACRRVLRDYHDAEDAWQATFLVLARKAGALERPAALGPWLYGVASRIARKARASLNRRRRHEKRARLLSLSQAPPAVESNDLRPLLDQELSRLPERHRAAAALPARVYWPRVTVVPLRQLLKAGCRARARCGPRLARGVARTAARQAGPRSGGWLPRATSSSAPRGAGPCPWA